MQSLFPKIRLVPLLILLVFTLSISFTFIPAPQAEAQEFLEDPLDAIKRKLEAEGIEVIEYGEPKGEWGSLPADLVEILTQSGIESLDDFVTHFEGKDIEEEEEKIKGAIKEEIKDIGIGPQKAFPGEETEVSEVFGLSLSLEQAVNLIFLETKFRLTYRKWGNLPQNVIDVLEVPTGIPFKNLNELKKLVDAAPGPPENFFKEFYEDKLSADEIDLIIGEMQFRGESQINAIILAVANVLRNILGALAILWIVISGIEMVLAHGEEAKITEQKRSITYALIGLVLVLLLERIIFLVYGVPGVERGITEIADVEEVRTELLGVVSFIKALIGSIAILMIIISGFKTLFAQGEEDKITTQHKAILWVIVGLIVIVINQVIIENLYIAPIQEAALRQLEAEGEVAPEITLTNVQKIINTFGTVTQFLLGFVGLLAFGALIYGAASMIMNLGNDELIERGKKIVKNAIIGIVVILSAYALVATVIKFQ